MEYSIVDCFMLGMVLGLVFAPIYEGLRIVRLVFRARAVVFLCDVVFFVLAGEAVFRLSLVLGDHVRGYTVVGFGAGIFAYITTLGRLLNAAESGAAVLWRKTIGRLFSRISAFFKGQYRAFAQNVRAVFGKVADFFGGCKKRLGEGLIFRHKMGYNIKTDYINDNRGSVTHNVIQAQVRRSP